MSKWLNLNSRVETYMEENFENTKYVIRSGKWQNDRQYNGQEKQVNGQ
jgi:hypothetical protein